MLGAVTVLNRMLRVGLIEVILERKLESSEGKVRKELGYLGKEQVQRPCGMSVPSFFKDSKEASLAGAE